MHRFILLIVTTFLIASCQSPEDKIVSNSSDIIKGIIDNPQSFKYKDMEFMGNSTYGASIKFWENYFRQNYIKTSNPDFNKEIAAVKEKFKSKMDQTSVSKYKINYFETDVSGKINDKSRVLYFDENQDQVKGMVYIYGMDAFEFDGLNEFKKYGVIE